MQYHALLLIATVATALAIPTPLARRPSTGSSPGRVLTKTYSYDSSLDLDDPCNPVTGDPERCLQSMVELAPSPNAPSEDRYRVAEELAVAQNLAQGSDFDILYERGAKKSQGNN